MAINPALFQGLLQALSAGAGNIAAGVDATAGTPGQMAQTAPNSTSTAALAQGQGGAQTPTVDQNGRLQQPAPQVVDPATEAAQLGANAPGMAPQLAASRLGQDQQQAQQSAGMPPQQSTQTQNTPGAAPTPQPSALGGAGNLTPEQAQQGASGAQTAGEQSIWQTVLNNLTGQGLDSPEALKEWRQGQTLGVLGNRLGAAVAGEQTGIGGAAKALGDTFAGNLMSKNAEERDASLGDWLSKALAGLGGRAKTPTTSGTGATAGTAGNTPGQGSLPPSGGSALSTDAFNAATGSISQGVDAIAERMRRLSGI